MSETESDKAPQSPWKRLVTEKPDRVIELGIAAAILVISVLNWSNLKSSSVQTDQLISAAKISAQAATDNVQASRNFDNSARSINQGIGDAVDKLNLQAATTEGLVEQAVVQASATNRLAAQAARSAKTASEQLSLMQQQFDTSQRPWISVVSVSVLGVWWYPYESRWSLDVEPKIAYSNIGNLPAVNIYVAANMVYADQTQGVDFKASIIRRQKDFCEASSKNDFYNKFLSAQTLFPKKQKDFSYSQTTVPVGTEIRPTDQLVSPVLIGCIFYQSSSSKTIHQTGFIFTLEKKDQSPFAYGQSITPSDVIFSDAWNGNASSIKIRNLKSMETIICPSGRQRDHSSN